MPDTFIEKYLEDGRRMSKMGFACPVFIELQAVAFKALSNDIHDMDGRKHRRAVIMHVPNCKHRQCMAMTALLGSEGLEMVHHLKEAEVDLDKKTQEDLK